MLRGGAFKSSLSDGYQRRIQTMQMALSLHAESVQIPMEISSKTKTNPKMTTLHCIVTMKELVGETLITNTVLMFPNVSVMLNVSKVSHCLMLDLGCTKYVSGDAWMKCS